MQDLGTEAIYEVPEALPHHHLDEWIRHEIAVGGLDVAGLDVRKWVRKLARRRIREAVEC